MAADYIPTRDAQALAWLSTFAGKLNGNCAAYMVTPSEAAAVQNVVNAFAAALADAQSPEKRTPVAVSLKDESRNAAIQLCRQYAMMVKHNAGISDPDKIAAGVRPVNPNRRPILCPQTAPTLNIVASTFGRHTLTYADSLAEESRAKPFGATELHLFVAIGDDVVPDPLEAKFYGKFTRNPMTIAFVHEHNRRQATYFARWAGRRGDVSSWSGPATLAIAA